MPETPSKKFVLTIEVPEIAVHAFAETVGGVVRKVVEEMAKTRPYAAPIPAEEPPKPFNPCVREIKGMINERQVAKILGISPRTVWQMRVDERMPKPVRFNTLVRWPEDEIYAWIKVGCPSGSEWAQMREKAGGGLP